MREYNSLEDVGRSGDADMVMNALQLWFEQKNEALPYLGSIQKIIVDGSRVTMLGRALMQRQVTLVIDVLSQRITVKYSKWRGPYAKKHKRMGKTKNTADTRKHRLEHQAREGNRRQIQ